MVALAQPQSCSRPRLRRGRFRDWGWARATIVLVYLRLTATRTPPCNGKLFMMAEAGPHGAPIPRSRSATERRNASKGCSDTRHICPILPRWIGADRFRAYTYAAGGGDGTGVGPGRPCGKTTAGWTGKQRQKQATRSRRATPVAGLGSKRGCLSMIPDERPVAAAGVRTLRRQFGRIYDQTSVGDTERQLQEDRGNAVRILR